VHVIHFSNQRLRSNACELGFHVPNMFATRLCGLSPMRCARQWKRRRCARSVSDGGGFGVFLAGRDADNWSLIQ
jgi:hypothetical protein